MPRARSLQLRLQVPPIALNIRNHSSSSLLKRQRPWLPTRNLEVLQSFNSTTALARNWCLLPGPILTGIRTDIIILQLSHLMEI